MRFTFTEQQTEFRDAVRQVLDKECTTTDLRAAFEDPAVHTNRWSTLAEMGVVGLTVPEAQGGLGMTLLDLTLLLEEAGRVGLPEPLADTTAVVAPLLAGVGSDRAQHLLEGIAGGSIAAAVAPAGLSPVPGADGADLIVVVTDEPGSGPAVHALGTDAVTVTPVPSLDPTRRLGTLTWEPSPGTLLVSGDEAGRAIAGLTDRATIATAAELLGLAERMITIAADYAKERKQFGKPIGSFQAVKHLLAGAQVKLEFARPAVYAAAWAYDRGDVDVTRSASLAKATASDAATEAARVSLQVHGAIGYTWECDLHLFLKRAWALAEAWGSAADHRSRILTSLVGELTV